MDIKPKQPSVKGPDDWFAGDVWIDAIAQGGEPSRLAVSAVHFTPGACTAWHSHSLGQTSPKAKDSSNPAASRSSLSGPAMSSTRRPTSGTGTGPHRTAMTHLSLTEAPARWGEHVIDAEYQGEQR